MMRAAAVAIVASLAWTLGFAANDPKGLAPHPVVDLRYGDVLFYFYQDDYFAAITRLLAAQELNLLPNTSGESELLLGGLYLSLGEHVEAGRIFEILLTRDVPESVRNRAWYYLGKVWYQRGYLEESAAALQKVSAQLEPRLAAQRDLMLAQILMREERYDEAITTLRGYHGPPDWHAYAKFNLGVALVRLDRLGDAMPFLDSVGLIETRSEELLALKDKANLALGFALLQAQRAADAKQILERVRLEGPFSSKALLGVGWADAILGEYRRSLVPWMALRKRNLLDAAVQESYLAVPYAFGKLQADGQSAEYYRGAIDSFDGEMQRIDASIGEIRAGKLLDRILTDDREKTLTWDWQLRKLPDAPESRYLYELLATDEFQAGLKNYRELNYMSRNLQRWVDSLVAYDEMIDTRQQAFAQRMPKADAALAATDLAGLAQRRVDFDARLDDIEKNADVAALGTPEEQALWARVQRLEAYLATRPDDPELEDMRAKSHLMKGVLYWRLSASFKARVWKERRSVRDLNIAVKEAARRAELVRQAQRTLPANTGEYSGRITALRTRMDDLQQRLAAAATRQNAYLQSLAIEALEGQKQRLATYQIQARYALATIYDRASDQPARPGARP